MARHPQQGSAWAPLSPSKIGYLERLTSDYQSGNKFNTLLLIPPVGWAQASGKRGRRTLQDSRSSQPFTWPEKRVIIGEEFLRRV